MTDAVSAQILIVDDARDIREPLGHYLRKEGYRVRLAASAEEARAILDEAVIHLVILDIMMPGETGLSLLGSLSEQSPPVILLTARTETAQVVNGLDLGAEDYITKPFEPQELLARIRAALRRNPATLPSRNMSRRAFAGLTYDPVSLCVTLEDGTQVALTASESRLLSSMLERPNHIFSRERLLDLVWGRQTKAYDRAIDNIVSRLRTKIGDKQRSTRLILTEWGGGYRLAADVEDIA